MARSEARTAATVLNWSGKTLSPGALLAVPYFSSCHIFFRPFRLFLVPTICPWVSEDGNTDCFDQLCSSLWASRLSFFVYACPPKFQCSQEPISNDDVAGNSSSGLSEKQS